jgi:hypothetical protein
MLLLYKPAFSSSLYDIAVLLLVFSKKKTIAVWALAFSFCFAQNPTKRWFHHHHFCKVPMLFTGSQKSLKLMIEIF